MKKPSKHSLYWGTLHNHSTISWDVVQGRPQKIYRLAQKDGLDFCSITDHDSPLGVGGRKRKWQRAVRLTNKFNQPGKFVTFIGYEWTSGQGPPFYQLLKTFFLLGSPRTFNFRARAYGHKNVYFPGKKVPEKAFAWNRKGSDTPLKLWEKLAPYQAMTITHHPLGGPTPAANWNYCNPQFEPLVEIYSIHGNSESENCRYRIYHPDLEGTHSVQAALNRGHILGFTAGTDSHRYTNDALGTEAFWLSFLKAINLSGRLPGPGITGVYADKLTRKGLWQAFFKRRTFATTGARIKVWFKLNQAFMGEVIRHKRSHKKTQLKFEVEGTEKLAKLEIIKNGRVIKKIDRLNKPKLKRTFTDRTKLKDHNYYYLRVHQQDGHMAWSSPIWIKKPKKGK